jgi:C4-dicarboxylate transporter
MRAITNFFINHETLTGSIVGALLAALFGIISQKYLDRKREKIETKKIIELVKYEMELNYQMVLY